MTTLDGQNTHIHKEYNPIRVGSLNSNPIQSEKEVKMSSKSIRIYIRKPEPNCKKKVIYL